MTKASGDGPLVSLSDDVVTLRPWSRGDAPFMAAASADPAIRRYNGPHDRQGRPAPPLSTTDAEAAIEQWTANWRAFAATGTPTGVTFAITDGRSGELIGCCGLDDWTKEDVAQFGYWVAPAARGRGYATRAAILLTRWLFGLGAARVFLTIVAGNEDSVAVARRAGFVYEGTMRSHGVWQGQRCDVMRFAALPLEWMVPDEAGPSSYGRVPFDVDGYVRRATSGRGCFICRIARGEDDRHQVVYRDDAHIAFFNRYPTLVGYTLVAPLEHREAVVGDFSVDEYLSLFHVSRRTPVVGETPLNHEINRVRLLQLRDTVGAPFVEVFLSGNPDVLMKRVLKRAGDPESHPIKVHFTVEGARELLARPYVPLLSAGERIEVDTTDLDALEPAAIADQVKELLDRMGVDREARQPIVGRVEDVQLG